MKKLSLISLVSLWFIFINCKESLKAISKIGIWDVFEISERYSFNYNNPFTDLQLDVEFISPSGQTINFWGFYDGDEIWKIRFMPNQIGIWRYKAMFSDGSHEITGYFECIESDIPGMIGGDESNPMWFGFRGGKHILIRSLHVGDRFFADRENPVSQETWNEQQRIEFLDWFQRQGYNMLSIASHYLNRTEADRGKGWHTPDLWNDETQLPNPKEYQRLEVVLNELAKRKIIVYPFAGFFGKSSDFPTIHDKQKLYLKYTLARLAPYWNLLFNIAGPEPMLKKQHEKYRNAMEKEDIVRLGNLIKKLDVLNHLLSVHNPTFFAHDGDWFMEEDWYTFGTLQGPKTLNRQELSRKLLKNHHPQKPLLAQETLWGGNTFGHPSYTEIDIRKHAYVITMSAAAINFGDMNGSSSSGFSGTLDVNQKHQKWHNVIKAVWDFFETLPFYEMKPSQDLVNNGYCLANPGKEYWVYLESPGKVSVKVEDSDYEVEWINAQNTEDRRLGGHTKDGRNLVTPFGSDDWFLRIIINKNI